MAAVILLALVSAAAAAPHFSHYGRHIPEHHSSLSPYYRDDVFDTGNFWAHLSNELKQLDDMLADFSNRFPSSVSSEGVEGKQYVITIPLKGFEEKDIAVKAREGLLMVQASHKFDEGHQSNYLDVRTLPSCIEVLGTWTYENEVLKIVFPLKADHTTESQDVTTELNTESPKDISREQLEPDQDSGQDVDVGLGRGDLDKENAIQTNEIFRNPVEATTYAVDLKNEVEFVPVKY